MHLKKQTYLLPQHFEFFLKLACTYNLPSHNLPQLTYHNIFHGIIKNIQLHKQLLHCYIFYLGVAMTKQMKNQSKFDKFFLLVNLNYTMNDVLQHCFKTKLGQNITFHWNNVIFFSPLTWLPKPYNDLHVSINNLIWE